VVSTAKDGLRGPVGAPASRLRAASKADQGAIEDAATRSVRSASPLVFSRAPRYTRAVMSRELLRALPQIEKALGWEEIEALVAAHSRAEVTRALRAALDAIRNDVIGARGDTMVDGDPAGGAHGADGPHGADGAHGPHGAHGAHAESVSRGAIVARTRELLGERARSGYRRVINGTGVLLHTGLGRAVLAAPAVDAVANELRGYSMVEVDPASGERNEREAALRALLCELTGAESATVVNNNAAATLLILAAFARGREVVLSRGQMVEIGGSFRVPEILAESGARLVEVGTTNRTWIRDYAGAIGPDTALLLEVHTSNYAIRGFARHTPLEEIVALGRERGIPVASDLGSGCFLDVTRLGFEPEPIVRDVVAEGPDLVCFSGDKLLGGPQAGIIVGKRDAIERVRRHPLFRTLRVDKVTLTLLDATLRLYRDPDGVLERVPILRQLATPSAAIEARVEAFIARLTSTGTTLCVASVPSAAQTGSGSLPDQRVPSRALALAHPRLSTRALAEALRNATPSVFTRVHDERALIDFRTVFERDEDELLALLAAFR